MLCKVLGQNVKITPPGCILSLKYSTVFRHADQHWNTSLCMIWNIVEHRAAGTRSVKHGNACFFFICLWTLKLAVNHKNKSAIMSFANSFKMRHRAAQSNLKQINNYLHMFIDLVRNLIYTIKKYACAYKIKIIKKWSNATRLCRSTQK